MGAERILLHRHVYPEDCEAFFPLPVGATHYASRRLVDGPAVDFWRFGSERSHAEADAAVPLEEPDEEGWRPADPSPIYSQKALDNARLEGFADAEELILEWLEAASAAHPLRRYTAASLALAIRMGQHKREADHG